jgi:two-component system OmpR family sensor kinase
MIAKIKHIWPLGIRLQLMLLYTSVFAMLLFASGFFLYIDLENSLADSFDTSLKLQAQAIGDDVHWSKGRITLDDIAADLPGFTTNTSSQTMSSKEIKYGQMVRLLDAQGHPVHETPAFSTLIVPPQSITNPMIHRISYVGSTKTREGDPVRLYSQRITEHNKIFAIVQVGQSLSELHDTEKRISKTLLEVGVIVLFFSAIGSYLLTYSAFQPIERLIQAAREIKAGDLRKRVPVPRAKDEVHALAVTLNEMIAHLDEMFTRQRRFVADASHELRTPIAAIRSKTDVALLQIDLPDEYATVLHDINLETVRLSHLINDLLALARGDEGQTRFEQEPVLLNSLAEMVAANAESLAAERQVNLQVHASGPITILGDEARLIQMIINLVDNAILYTNPGGRVTVTVKSTRTHATLIVQDTGIGIAPEHLPHIFERFYRADPAHVRTERGSSGLGLSIVAWIIQAHKGTITVESQKGRGSTFIVALPLATPKPAITSKLLTTV